jgi:hypothetical protein
MVTNLANSLSPTLPQPSAIFVGMDADARRN